MHQPTHTPPEEWRPVIGYEGAYEVSNHGRVRSLDRIITTKAGVRKRTKGRLLKPGLQRRGHLSVIVGGDAKRVHRLVLEAFVGPAPKGHECCHSDGNPANNHLSNLRWGSQSENTYDRVRHGTHNNAAKTHCPRGHDLVAPNLIPHKLKLGYRGCLACARAHSHVHRHPQLKTDLQQIADEYHQQIMSA